MGAGASRRAAVSSPGRSPTQPVPGPRRPRPVARLAVRRRDARRGAAVQYLRDGLRRRLSADVAPPLARAPAGGCCASAAGQQLLVLTTNYDDLVERALDGRRRAVRRRLVRGEARAARRAASCTGAPDGEACRSSSRTSTPGSPLAERPVILKLHGAIDRADSRRDSYVITEDSYIDYLVGSDVGQADPVPRSLRTMTDSHFLFLGYSMRDWNLRVILKPDLGRAAARLKSWAVQRAARRCGRARGRGGALARPRRHRPRLRALERVRRAARARAHALPLGAATMTAVAVAAGRRPGSPGDAVRRARPLRRGRRDVLLRPRRGEARSSPRTCAPRA